MKKILSITMFAVLLTAWGCKKDSEFLNIPPIQVLPNDVAFSDPALVLSILGDLYNRQIDFASLDGFPTPDPNNPVNNNSQPGWRTFTDFSESFPSENGCAYIVQRTGWGYYEWFTW